MQPIIDVVFGVTLAILIVPPWIWIAGLIKRRWPL